MTDLIARAEALEAEAKELRRQAAERPLEGWLGMLGPGASCASPWGGWLYKTQEEATKAAGWSGGSIRKWRELRPVRVTEAQRAQARALYCGYGINTVMDYTIREICGLEVES